MAAFAEGTGQPVSLAGIDVPFLLDSFGNIRTTQNVRTTFDSLQSFGINPLVWDTLEVNGGTLTYDADENSITLACTGTTGSKAALGSRAPIRYQPGKSNRVKGTCNWNSSAGTFATVVRSSTSGTPAENRFTQAQFNVSTLPSLNLEKRFLGFFDFAYLGVGNVQFQVYNSGGVPESCHIFKHGNQAFGSDNGELMYMKTPILPYTVEIENDGTNIIKRIGYLNQQDGIFWEVKEPAGTGSFKFFCGSVHSENGESAENERGFPWSASRGTTAQTVGASLEPLVSIRPKATHNTKANNGILIPNFVNAFTTNRDAYCQVILNGTLGSGTDWTDKDANSIAQFDIGSTTVSGGQVIKDFYIQADSTIDFSKDLLSRLALAVTPYSNTQDVLTLAAQRLGNNVDMYGSIGWKELY